jgi:lipopolysaccharide export system protein LptA
VHKLLLLSLFVVLSLPAQAEKADRNKPVHLEADNVTLDDVRKLSVFQGNVLLVQGTLMLRADHVEARQNDDGLQGVTATGKPVSFRQKRDGVDEYIEGFADSMDYDGVQSVLRLQGNARLRKGGDEIRGAQITYDAKTEFYKVIGQQNVPGSSGRVRVIIRPKPKTDQPAAGAEKSPTRKP